MGSIESPDTIKKQRTKQLAGILRPVNSGTRLVSEPKINIPSIRNAAQENLAPSMTYGTSTQANTE